MKNRRVIKGRYKKVKLKQRRKVREGANGDPRSRYSRQKGNARVQRLNLIVTNSKACND